MAGTISFGGIGSGMDTEGIVTGLVQASSGQLNTFKARAKETDSAVSNLSSLASLFAKFQKSVDALTDSRDIGSYSATSSNAAIAVSANGAAQPGSYDIEVVKLAKEQRNYSTTFSSSTDALGQAGTLSLKVGNGTQIDLTIDGQDSLEAIAKKINGAGLRVSASIFNDGTSSRLQVRGLDTGAANAVTLGEAGTNLGLSQPGSLFQAAQDSSVKIDGFTVTRPTNQIVGALSGVTLALTAETTTPVTVTVASDPQGLQTKLQSVVDSYNAIVSKIHQTAGFGSTKGTDPVLQGDSTLRSITSRLTRVFQSTVTGSGTYETLGSIGLSLNRDGTLGVDATKLTKALQTDASSVTRVLAGAGDGAGAMDTLSSVVKGMTQSGGVIDARKEALESRAKALRERADREEDRLNRYADTLRKQFMAMDTTVASNQSQLEYLVRLYSG